MTIFNDSYFSIDTVDADATLVDADGNEVNDSDSFDWSEHTTVTINNQPWIDRFGTDTYHRLEYNLAKPLPQTYTIDGNEYTFVKPRDALKKAQWGLDNLPWTIEHPKERRVVDDSQIRAFWKGPMYDDDSDLQKAYLYLPTNDDEAKGFVEDHNGASVGFKHNLIRIDDYDGEIGGDFDLDEIDAFQIDLFYDHAASVQKGRFPSSKGGGLVVDSAIDVTTDNEDEGDSSENVDDGSTDNEGPSVSTKNTKSDLTMTDDNDEDDLFGIDTMTVDAIADANDDVSDLKEKKEQYENTVDSIKSDLEDNNFDVDVEDVVDELEDLQKQKGVVEDTLDDVKSELKEYKDEERKELAETLTDMTDRWSEEEIMGTDDDDSDPWEPSEIKEKIELVDDLVDSTSTTTIDADDDGDDEVEDEYDTSGPIDLSNTA